MSSTRSEKSLQDEALLLLERFPYWPHAPHRAAPSAVARFALGIMQGATFYEHRGSLGELVGLAARQHLQWDSERLGLTAARVTFVVLPGQGDLARVMCASAINAARDDGYGYLFTRLDARDLVTVQACEKEGFVTVDSILSQYLDVAAAAPVAVPPAVEVREATAADAELVSGLVDRTLSHSRFHDDPLVGVERGREIYREWGRNCVKGLNELTLVAERSGSVLGFLSVKDNQAARNGLGLGYGRIELVGVLAEHRGSGVVRALVAALLERCPRFGWSRLGVGTQTWNIPAIRAYQKAGFTPGDSIFSMRWRSDDQLPWEQ